MVENTLLWMFMNEEKYALDECEQKKTRHLKDFKTTEEKLLKVLNKEQTKLFKDFRYHFLYHILEVRDIECSNIVFECLKIGMEFQKHFDDKESEYGTPILEDC